MKKFAFLLLLFTSFIYAQEPKKEIYWTEIIERAVDSKDSIIIFDDYIIKNNSKKFQHSNRDPIEAIQIKTNIEILNSVFDESVRIKNIIFKELYIDDRLSVRTFLPINYPLNTTQRQKHLCMKPI